MLKRLGTSIAAALFLIGAAQGQSVQQSGAVTPNTAAIWNGTGIVKGGVTAPDSPLTTFGVTRDAADAICVSSDRQTAVGRNTLCFQAATSGPAKITLQNFGTASAQNLQFVLNGVTLTLPSGGGTFVTATGVFTAGHAACWNSTTGILMDCGVSIAAGTQFGLPYYSTASTLGSTGAGANGQFLVGQTGSVPLWTTLSGDVSSVTSGGALTLSKVNGIPFSTSYTAHGVLLAQGTGQFTSSVTSNIGNCLLSQGTSSDPVWASCASGSGSAGGSNTQVQFNNTTSLAGSVNLTWVSPALTLGVAGTTTGQLALASASNASGVVTLQNPSGSSAFNFNFPTGAGTSGQPLISGGGGGTPMTFGTLGISGGGTNCAVAAGTCLDNITGFSTTGFLNRTGAGTYTTSTTIPVSGGGTAIASGNSGGILGFTAAGTIASSAALTQFGLVVGGGAGSTPTAITPGSSAQILIQQNAANPAWQTLGTDATISAAGALTIANSAVTLAKQANMAAFSLQGNFTGSSTAPQASTLAALTLKASPAASDDIMIGDNAAAGAIKRASVSSIASAGSVSSIAGNTGAFTVAGGVTNSTNQIQFDGKYASLNAGFNCTLTASVGSSLLTVALKDAGGNDPSATSPCYINYRDPTASTGATTLVSQIAALSVATTNTGSAGSLGSSNSTAFRLWVVSFNNGGTNVLSLINCSISGQIFPLNEGVVASSTPFSASATSAGIFYTPSGITIASKAFRIVGYIEYNSTGLATAGTYVTAPNFVQNFGPGIRKPGEVVQWIMPDSVTGGGTTTTIIPFDNTIPQITEGTEFMAQSITPTSAANVLQVDTGAFSSGSVAAHQVMALFQDATSNALSATASFQSTLTATIGTALSKKISAATTSSTTFRVRMGLDRAGTFTFGGTGAVQIFGGVGNNYIRIQEIMG